MSFPQRRGFTGRNPVLTAPGGGAQVFSVGLAQTTPYTVVSFGDGQVGGWLLRSICLSYGGVAGQSVWLSDARAPQMALAFLSGADAFMLLGGLFVPATTNGSQGNTITVSSSSSSPIGVNLAYDEITEPFTIN